VKNPVSYLFFFTNPIIIIVWCSWRCPNFRCLHIDVTRDMHQELTEQYLQRLCDAITTSCNNCHVGVATICRVLFVFLFPPFTPCQRQPISWDELYN